MSYLYKGAAVSLALVASVAFLGPKFQSDEVVEDGVDSTSAPDTLAIKLEQLNAQLKQVRDDLNDKRETYSTVPKAIEDHRGAGALYTWLEVIGAYDRALRLTTMADSLIHSIGDNRIGRSIPACTDLFLLRAEDPIDIGDYMKTNTRLSNQIHDVVAKGVDLHLKGKTLSGDLGLAVLVDPDSARTQLAAFDSEIQQYEEQVRVFDADIKPQLEKIQRQSMVLNGRTIQIETMIPKCGYQIKRYKSALGL